MLLEQCRLENEALNRRVEGLQTALGNRGSTPPGLTREEGDTAATPHPQQNYPTPPHQQERQEQQERMRKKQEEEEQMER